MLTIHSLLLKMAISHTQIQKILKLKEAVKNQNSQTWDIVPIFASVSPTFNIKEHKVTNFFLFCTTM